MKKKIPHSFCLNVFGSKVAVLQVKNLSFTQGILGQYDPQTNKIIIDSEQGNDEKTKTIIHEAVHALLKRVGVTQTMSQEIEEVICVGVENLIFENFRLQLK